MSYSITKPRPSSSGDKKEHLGIPEVVFLSDVGEFITQAGGKENLVKITNDFSKLFEQYRYMEAQLTAKRTRLKERLPDLISSLKVLDQLKAQKNGESFDTTFQLADTLFTTATIDQTDSVCLWLGANVMCEYPLDDAHEFLTKNLSTLQKGISETEENLGFLKDQITTVEVNMARLHNWNMQQRQPPNVPAQAS